MEIQNNQPNEKTNNSIDIIDQFEIEKSNISATRTMYSASPVRSLKKKNIKPFEIAIETNDPNHAK